MLTHHQIALEDLKYRLRLVSSILLIDRVFNGISHLGLLICTKPPYGQVTTPPHTCVVSPLIA
jgi:hypothetical protein